MSVRQEGSAAPAPGAAAGPWWRRWSVLLPALTFLVGLLLGAAVIAALSSDGDDERAAPRAPAPAPTAQPSPSAALTVRVPEPCVRAADKAEQAYALLEQGVAAARDLDARGLQELVDTVQRERPQVEALVRQCREQSATALAQPTPAASSTP